MPSLFDALRAGKPLTHRQPTAGVRPGRAGTLRFMPEALVHPFTQAFRFRTTGRVAF